MPAATNVWAVRAGSTEDVACSMTLEGSDLVLSSETTVERIPLSAVRRTRRVRGSPVLVVRLEGEGLPPRILLYFSRPPPLPGAQEIGRRRARRRNVTYLGTRGTELKREIREWVRAIREGAGLGGRA